MSADETRRKSAKKRSLHHVNEHSEPICNEVTPSATVIQRPVKRPVRSCITCKRKGAKGELVKLADTPQGVVADYSEKLPGRGAYVCAEIPCIKGALNARALSRAFRKKTVPPPLEGFIEGLRLGIQRRIASLVGMARKSGKAVWGFDACIDKMRKTPGGLLIVAGDISENTLGKLGRERPEEAGRSMRFLTRDGLGRLLGTAPVAVVYVSDHGLAAAIGFELGRLILINRG